MKTMNRMKKLAILSLAATVAAEPVLGPTLRTYAGPGLYVNVDINEDYSALDCVLEDEWKDNYRWAVIPMPDGEVTRGTVAYGIAGYMKRVLLGATCDDVLRGPPTTIRVTSSPQDIVLILCDATELASLPAPTYGTAIIHACLIHVVKPPKGMRVKVGSSLDYGVTCDQWDFPVRLEPPMTYSMDKLARADWPEHETLVSRAPGAPAEPQPLRVLYLVPVSEDDAMRQTTATLPFSSYLHYTDDVIPITPATLLRCRRSKRYFIRDNYNVVVVGGIEDRDARSAAYTKEIRETLEEYYREDEGAIVFTHESLQKDWAFFAGELGLRRGGEGELLRYSYVVPGPPIIDGPFPVDDVCIPVSRTHRSAAWCACDPERVVAHGVAHQVSHKVPREYPAEEVHVIIPEQNLGAYVTLSPNRRLALAEIGHYLCNLRTDETPRGTEQEGNLLANLLHLCGRPRTDTAQAVTAPSEVDAEAGK